MTARLDYYNIAPDMLKPMLALEAAVRGGALERELVELVKLRASQINGCAYCLHMHSRDARAGGMDQARLDLLPAWRESSLYSPRERAALAWTEALTLLAQTGAPDEDYAGIAEHFDEAERVQLSMLICTINAWNRLAVGFRSEHPKAPEKGAGKADAA